MRQLVKCGSTDSDFMSILSLGVHVTLGAYAHTSEKSERKVYCKSVVMTIHCLHNSVEDGLRVWRETLRNEN
jgi:hypothetical protein